MIQERSCSSGIFLERSPLQKIWKKEIWFLLQCDVAKKTEYNELVKKVN